jgi:hypothetical protein
MIFKNKTFWAVAALLVLIIGYFYTQVDWETRAIRKQFDGLIEQVEKDGPASTFEALGRSRKVVAYFAPEPSVEYFPGRHLPKDLDAMGGAFISVWGQIEKASVRVIRHDVTIDETYPEAESLVTARCSVILNGSEQMGDTIKYRINWIQIDGDWRIQAVVALAGR